jgi:hypothetical protein
MSEASRNLVIARIPGSQSLVNNAAPVKLGCKHGYFKDQVTRTLLGLNKGDFLRADGTYGKKELADKPVKFSLIREESYDCRLLPFILACRGTMRQLFVELCETNKQWKPAM